MRINDLLKLAVSVAVSEMAGVVGAVFTTPAIDSGWYAALVKPALNPPAWIFGPVWTLLYILMGLSLFFVWRQRSSPRGGGAGMLKMIKYGVALFFVQLALNASWSIIFFGWQNPAGALVEIILLWLAIFATIAVFYKISKPAVWLLVPYILWVSFAIYLNAAIWSLN